MFWRGHPQQNERCNPRCLVHLGLFIFFAVIPLCAQSANPEILRLEYAPEFPEGMDVLVQQRKTKLPGDRSRELRERREPLRLNASIRLDELESYAEIIESSFSRVPVFSELASIQCRNARDVETSEEIRAYCAKIISLGIISSAVSYLLPAQADLYLKYPSIPLYRLCFAYAALAESGLRNMAGEFYDSDYSALLERMQKLKAEFIRSDKDEVRFGNLGFNYKGYFIEIDWSHRGFSQKRKRCYDEYASDVEGSWSVSTIFFREMPESVGLFKDEVFLQLNEIYLSQLYLRLLQMLAPSRVLPQASIQAWQVREEYEKHLYPGSALHLPEEDLIQIERTQFVFTYMNQKDLSPAQYQRSIAQWMRAKIQELDQAMDQRILELETQVILEYPSASEIELKEKMEIELRYFLPKLRREFAGRLMNELQSQPQFEISLAGEKDGIEVFSWKEARSKLGPNLFALLKEQRDSRRRAEYGVYLPMATEFLESKNEIIFHFLFDFETLQSSYKNLAEVFHQMENIFHQKRLNQNLVESLKNLLRYPVVQLREPDTYWELAVPPEARTANELNEGLLRHLSADNVRQVIRSAIQMQNFRLLQDQATRLQRKVY